MKRQENKGFTIVELIIILALLAIVLGAVFTFFSFARGSFDRTNAQARLMQEMNLAVKQITADIRSASKPNSATRSVVVQGAAGSLSEGQSMWIYSYDTMKKRYIRICYRLNPSDKTVMQRGTAVCPGELPPQDENPEYAEITDWKDVLTGVIYMDGNNNDIAIFKDETSPSSNDRRKIRLGIRINDAQFPLPEPVEVNMAVTSRSEGVPG